MKRNNKIILPLVFVLMSILGKGQDLIMKNNGDSIKCKITEVGLTTVAFYKSDLPKGPLFTVSKNEIKFIRLANGEQLDISKQLSESSLESKRNPADSTKKSSDKNAKNKIELLNEAYYINGVKAKKKDVDRYLSKSNNPAIVLGLKGAKSMSLAQKITKITSYPTTIGGSVLSLVKIAETYQLVQRGRATPKAFLNTGLSIVGTIAFPITSKILGKKTNKMYDKLIDMYNVTN